jgi:hypothetical protein
MSKRKKNCLVAFAALLYTVPLWAGMPSAFKDVPTDERVQLIADVVEAATASQSTARTMAVVDTDPDFTVETADDWTALFYHNNGKYGPAGSDGMSSFTVTGNEAYGASPVTIFTTGDTFFGTIDPDTGARGDDTMMVNNSIIMLIGNQPNPWLLTYIYPTDSESGLPMEMSEPDVEGVITWFFDGFTSITGQMNIFGVNMNGWYYDSVSMSVGLPLPVEGSMTQFDTGLYTPAASDGSSGAITYGGCVLLNTFRSNSPVPDGKIYIFGTREDKVFGFFPAYKNFVARSSPLSLYDTENWEYWNGSDWVKDYDQAAPITDAASNELNVGWYKDGDGNDILVMTYMKDVFSSVISMRIAQATPEDGFQFGPAVDLYTCPEWAADPTGMTISYGAKGHPQLSAPGKILISYNVNTWNNEANLADGSIYHPRWIEVTLEPSSE